MSRGAGAAAEDARAARDRRARTRRARDVSGLLAIDLAVPAGMGFATPVNPLAVLGLAFGMVTTYRWAGLYRRRFSQSVLDELPYLVLGILVGFGVGALALLVDDAPTCGELFAGFVLTVTVVIAGRTLVYRLRRRRAPRHAQRGGTRVLIVGTGAGARELARRITTSGQGAALVGFLGAEPDGGALVEQTITAPVIGDYADFGEVVETFGVNIVVCAFPELQEWQLAHLLRRDAPPDVEVYTVPNGYSMCRWGGPWADHIRGIPIIPVAPAQMRWVDVVSKRVLDIVLALVALVLLSPVLLAVALAVRIELGRGVIFRQERIGKGGATFTMLKFRSMHPAREGDSQTRWSIAGDQRIGAVGRFIRATSLDELPQLFNILRGDMSFVGPRPERPYFVERYSQIYPDYEDRHRAPAGLTGYAAVQGLRGDTDIAERAHFDNLYIDNWSMWQDLKIIVRTVGSVFGRHGS